jgi:hypothetical protein
METPETDYTVSSLCCRIVTVFATDGPGAGVVGEEMSRFAVLLVLLSSEG